MSSLTLGARVKAALQGPPKRTQRALAAAAGISPVSVNDWVSDRTKTIEGAHLLKAAKFLGVSPRWLAEGKGPMRPAGGEQAPDAEPDAQITLAQAVPIVLQALHKVPPQSRPELAQVLGLLVTTGSPHYAQRVAELMAGEPTASQADVARATAIKRTVESPRFQPQQLKAKEPEPRE